MSLLKLIKYSLATVIFSIVFPILLVFIFFPFYIYRNIVRIWAWYIHRGKGLGKIITTRATLFSTDELFTTPQCNVAFAVTIKGTVDLSLLRDQFTKTTLELKNPSGNGFWYPELKQCLYKFGGYSFWKDVDNFDIENHIRHSNEFPSKERIGDEEVHKIVEDLIHKEWKQNTPLWEIIIKTNYFPSDSDEPCTAFFFRFHHVLSDGQGIFTIFIKHLSQTKDLEFKKPKTVDKSIFSSLFYKITFPFRAVFATVRFFMQLEDKYPWSVPTGKQTKSLMCLCPPIPVETIKHIRNKFNVSFSSVLLAAITGAHRETFIRKNIPIPRHLPAFCPFPLGKHSGKLRNQVSCVIVNLPVTKQTPAERLRKCDKIYENIRNSPEPVVIFILGLLTGLLPDKLYRATIVDLPISTGISILPVSPHKLMFPNGEERFLVEDLFYAAGLLIGTTGLGFAILTYADGIRILGGGYECLMSQEDYNEFTLEAKRQIEILAKEDVQ